MWPSAQAPEAPPLLVGALPLSPTGLRTEQDLYVRLIDSMSKQVSRPSGGCG